MSYQSIFFSKNDYLISVPAASGLYKQAIVLIDGAEVNNDAPELAGTVNNQCVFNLKNILSTYPFPSILYSELPSEKRAVQLVKNITVKTNNLGVNDFVISNPILFTEGYLDIERQLEHGIDFIKYWSETMGFYSTRPIIKETSDSLREWIYYLNNSNNNYTALSLQIDFFDDNGLISNHTISLNCAKNDLLIFDVSWSHLQIGFNDIGSCSYYQCYIKAGETTLTQKYHFQIDRFEPENLEILYFRNSFGIWDSIRFMKEATISKDFEHLSFESTQKRMNYLSWVNTKVSFPTGFLVQGWLQYLVDELLTSKEVYWLKSNKEVLVTPITTSSVVYDPEKMDEAVFEFKLANYDYR